MRENIMLKNEEDIINWLEEMEINNFSLREKNGQIFVDVNGSVQLMDRDLTSIPIQFGIVKGEFDCSSNVLTSLKGSPIEVQGFDCSCNKLTSLEYCPKKLDSLRCQGNLITSLKGCPKDIKHHFYCYENELTSLKYGPQIVGDDYCCDDNQLTSLKYGPKIVKGSFYCDNNKITSIMFAPEMIGEHLTLENNPINSIKGLKTKFSDEFRHSCSLDSEKIIELKPYYVKNTKNNSKNELYVSITYTELNFILGKILLNENLNKQLNENTSSVKKVKI